MTILSLPRRALIVKKRDIATHVSPWRFALQLRLICAVSILAAAGAASPAAAAVPLEALPRVAPASTANPFTPAKAALGQKLFFDPRLSKSGAISCNSCHNVMGAGDDDRANSVGVGGKTGGRSAPPVYNAAFLSVQFWDGRAASLEEQAKGPLINPIEMGMNNPAGNHDLVIGRIKAIPGYVSEFKTVFGAGETVTIDNVAKAIATYERTLITPDSPFDRFLGGDKKALPSDAAAGLKLVQEIGCTSCHQGPAFAGPALAEGQGFFQKFPVFPDAKIEKRYRLSKDLGRFTVTKNEADKNMWRVPSWRNVALTAPYFHNGSVPTLAEAVQIMGKTQLNKTLSAAETHSIVAFLTSLTGTFPAQTLPRLPETEGHSLIAVDEESPVN
jgi:cytochrome c peroxidase